MMTISPAHPRARFFGLAALALTAFLSACTSPRPPSMGAAQPPAMPSQSVAAQDPSLTQLSGPAEMRQPASRWLAVPYTALPGWQQDDLSQFWTALQASCGRVSRAMAPVWTPVCRDAARLNNAPADQQRLFLQRRLQPYRIEAVSGAAAAQPDVGLVTGYYEPILHASRLPQGDFRVPLWRPPADLKTRVPYWTRQQLDTLPQAQASVAGQAIAYVADPVEALILQIQGSGRAIITEPDGRRIYSRLKFAGHNGQPYRSVGTWLIQNGQITPAQANWPGISDWMQRNPDRVQSLLWQNPRVVFFQEEKMAELPPGADADHDIPGPVGAQGVPLTGGRSIAVDPGSIPYGTPVWLSTTEPINLQPLQRLVMAQDTGTAIRGAVRADYFWGAGQRAEQAAGRLKAPLRLWALWPRQL
ncbi:murein transglycosylase A [Amphibiibacter pelophylacis]|uniref:MltA domain-containing protein n=1 Tax=Amphibiibacter pelophylacis TaxID=1799477 RepID=A0ACC6P282_9BURK